MLENTQACPICNTTTNLEDLSDINSYHVNCPRCGKYTIVDGALTMFQRSDLESKVLSVGYWIKQHQSPNSKLSISENIMRKILIPFTPPKPKEQADNLLLWIGTIVNKPDAETEEPLPNLLPVVGTIDEQGIQYFANYLKDQGYIKHSGFSFSTQDGKRHPPVDLLRAQMTFKGWERYDELKRLIKDSKLAFMAMQYNDELLDKMYNNYFKPTLNSLGFKLVTLDERLKAGILDNQLREEIKNSNLLLVDLTHGNRGAYWEAGYAEGIGKPVIYLCERHVFKEKKIHFDTNHLTTITWNENTIVEDMVKLKAIIEKTFA